MAEHVEPHLMAKFELTFVGIQCIKLRLIENKKSPQVVRQSEAEDVLN